MSKKIKKFDLVLFDLDGTLADTANDMSLALNVLLKRKSKATISHEILRPHISNGTPALLKKGFNLNPSDIGYEELKNEFLDIYERNICSKTVLFPGIQSLLENLDELGIAWGIVTNKPEYLTVELIEKLGLTARVSCIIGGDTLPERKPSPVPILHACHLAGISPSYSVYIGDSSRDIEAGKRAGLATIGVTYGYILSDDDPYLWGADQMVNSAEELPQLLWNKIP